MVRRRNAYPSVLGNLLTSEDLLNSSEGRVGGKEVGLGGGGLGGVIKVKETPVGGGEVGDGDTGGVDDVLGVDDVELGNIIGGLSKEEKIVPRRECQLPVF